MATRSHTTFKKRQKEQARMEKQQDKAAKRVQRKLEKTGEGGVTATDESIDYDYSLDDDMGRPVILPTGERI